MTGLRSRSVSEAEHLLTYYQDDHDWLIFKIQVRGDRWVSYDDEHSVRLKAEFAFDKKLAGVMVWSVETDDFKVNITSIANNKNSSVKILSLMWTSSGLRRRSSLMIVGDWGTSKKPLCRVVLNISKDIMLRLWLVRVAVSVLLVDVHLAMLFDWR